MVELLIPTSLVILTATAVIVLALTGQIRLPRLITRSQLLDLVNRTKSPVSRESSNQINESSAQPDPRELNCRVQLTKQK